MEFTFNCAEQIRAKLGCYNSMPTQQEKKSRRKTVGYGETLRTYFAQKNLQRLKEKKNA